jgi:hypothetical protein
MHVRGTKRTIRATKNLPRRKKKVCLVKIIPNNGTKRRNTRSKKSGTKICGANFEE